MLPSVAMKNGLAKNIYDALVYCYHRDWPKVISDIKPMQIAYNAARTRVITECPQFAHGTLSPVIDFSHAYPVEVQIQVAINAGI